VLLLLGGLVIVSQQSALASLIYTSSESNGGRQTPVDPSAQRRDKGLFQG